MYNLLDYSILEIREESFIKDIVIFNLKDAIAEIISILGENIDSKKIKVETFFEGWRSSK